LLKSKLIQKQSNDRRKKSDGIKAMNGVIGISLLISGLMVVLYSIMPSTAWIGFLLSFIGAFSMYEWQKDKIRKSGIKVYIPDWMNDYLTRRDVVDQIVLHIRENGVFHKVVRLLMIKSLDLNREEVVEVLSGIWPRFRDLTNYEGSLIQFTPQWFQRIYGSPKQAASLTRQESIIDHHESDDAFNVYDDATGDSSPISNRVINDALSCPNRYEIYPLIMWIAERRIRRGVSMIIPKIGKQIRNILLPIFIAFMVYSKFPKSRRSITRFVGLMMALYAISITRGLPYSSRHILDFFGIVHRIKRGGHMSTPYTGSLGNVVYALFEPLIPMICPSNSNSSADYKYLPPSSPAPSQASTAPPQW